MRPKPGMGPRRERSPSPCKCNGSDRFECTDNEVYICVPAGGGPKREFLASFTGGNQICYTLCNNKVAIFEIKCPGEQPGYNKTCCYEEDDASSSGLSESTLNCTFEEKMETKYNIISSVCESGEQPTATETDSTTVVLKTLGVEPTFQKTTSYVTKSEKPITTKEQATSPTQPDSSVTSSTRGLPPSTSLVTDSTVKTTEKIDIPTPSQRHGYRIPVAVAVPLTLVFLLVALVIFVRWKKGGKRFCTKSRRKLNRSQKSTLNPDSSASALRVNPTYDLDGRLADDVIHLASLDSVQEEAGNYTEIPPREYESYRPNQNPSTYLALQKVSSSGNDENEDDDPPVYTPIPVNRKPAKNAKAGSDYVEPDTVLHHPGEGASTLNSSVPSHSVSRTDGKRPESHQDVRPPNPNSSGYVDVDGPPVVFTETPTSAKTSFKEPQDTGNPDDVYYFKLRGLSADASGELDRELLDPSAAGSGQYQSLGASSAATLPLDTKLVDEGDGYDTFTRNAINLAKTAANVTNSNEYDHVVIRAAAHSNGANNAYDTVERPRLESALKCGDSQQQGAAGGIINSSTGLKGETASYDVIERPGVKHSINTTGEGDYSLAMRIV